MQEHSLQALRATTAIQPRKHLQFVDVRQYPASESLPPFSRLLGTPHPGLNIASAEDLNGHKTVNIGVHRTPEQFVAAALEVVNPTLVHSLLAEEMRKVVRHCVGVSQESQAKERTAELRRWTSMAADLAGSEKRAAESMSPTENT